MSHHEVGYNRVDSPLEIRRAVEIPEAKPVALLGEIPEPVNDNGTLYGIN